MDLIILSLPWNAFVTLPRDQCEPGKWSSFIKTKSFSSKFRWLVSLFWRRCSHSTHSLIKRPQNKFATLCTDFHIDLYSRGDVSNIPAEWFSNFLLKILFVVNPSKSFESPLQGKSGLPFRMHSISQSIVISDSSWYLLSFVTVFMAVFDNLIRD